MAQNKVEFTINLNGNAYKGVTELSVATKKVCAVCEAANSKFGKFGETAIRLNSIVQLASSAFNTINGAMQSCVQANQAQQEAEAKLAQVESINDHKFGIYVLLL